jgi:hypothetical protein
MTKGQALAAVVLIHLGISVAHGSAHTGAQVPLPFAGTLFVYIVILAGPLAGLTLWRWRPRAGARLVAASMAGALVFGLVNHFIIDGPDHVARRGGVARCSASPPRCWSCPRPPAPDRRLGKPG